LLVEVVLLKNNKPHAGIIQIAREHEKSAWLPFIRVQNLQQILQCVLAADGERLVEPSEKIRNGKVSVIEDTHSTAIGLFEWPALPMPMQRPALR
jgi:predicted enzyme related to lactoylglutathione lyase